MKISKEDAKFIKSRKLNIVQLKRLFLINAASNNSVIEVVTICPVNYDIPIMVICYYLN